MNSNKTVNPSGLITFLILLLVSIGQLAVDLYLPSMPAIVEYFGTTADAVQMTLTWFLIGFSFSQLFYGPMSDTYGRRRIVLIGLLLFVLGGVGCIVASSSNSLLFFRFVQGIGAG